MCIRDRTTIMPTTRCPIERGNVMTEDTLSGAAAKPGMHDLADVSSLVAIQPEATVSRTVLQAEGARVVLFSFDVGQVLTEHTAAVPALLQVLDGHLRISADAAPSTCI